MDQKCFTRSEAEARVGRRRDKETRKKVKSGKGRASLCSVPLFPFFPFFLFHWCSLSPPPLVSLSQTVDWFSRDEYERYLEEIEEADDADDQRM